MTPLTLQILLALADHDMLSFEILQAVQEDSQMAFIIRDRSVYAALNRLVKENKIAREIDIRDNITYRLTPFGRRLLTAEHARIKHLAFLLGKRLDDR